MVLFGKPGKKDGSIPVRVDGSLQGCIYEKEGDWMAMTLYGTYPYPTLEDAKEHFRKQWTSTNEPH